ncbi:MAG: hypothetical protein R3240_04555, partial [Gammaproteobacteria bacterium]|nr:hypothetical protein [Gammaproteobacteria bacterium]
MKRADNKIFLPLLYVLSIFFPTFLSASDYFYPIWYPDNLNSQINDIKQIDGKIFVGGDFTKIRPNNRPTLLNLTKGELDRDLLKYEVTGYFGKTDGRDGWFLYDVKTPIGTYHQVHIRNDGSIDTNFNESTKGYHAWYLGLSRDKSYIYVQLTSDEENKLAKYNIETESLYDIPEQSWITKDVRIFELVEYSENQVGVIFSNEEEKSLYISTIDLKYKNTQLNKHALIYTQYSGQFANMLSYFNSEYSYPQLKYISKDGKNINIYSLNINTNQLEKKIITHTRDITRIYEIDPLAGLYLVSYLKDKNPAYAILSAGRGTISDWKLPDGATSVLASVSVNDGEHVYILVSNERERLLPGEDWDKYNDIEYFSTLYKYSYKTGNYIEKYELDSLSYPRLILGDSKTKLFILGTYNGIMGKKQKYLYAMDANDLTKLIAVPELPGPVYSMTYYDSNNMLKITGQKTMNDDYFGESIVSYDAIISLDNLAEIACDNDCVSYPRSTQAEITPDEWGYIESLGYTNTGRWVFSEKFKKLFLFDREGGKMVVFDRDAELSFIKEISIKGSVGSLEFNLDESILKIIANLEKPEKVFYEYSLEKDDVVNHMKYKMSYVDRQEIVNPKQGEGNPYRIVITDWVAGQNKWQNIYAVPYQYPQSSFQIVDKESILKEEYVANRNIYKVYLSAPGNL